MMSISPQPLFTILVDCADPPRKSVTDFLDDLSRQTYRNFEIILSGMDIRGEQLPRPSGNRGLFVEADSDITSILSDPEQRSYRGDFLILLEPSDKLFPDALESIVERLSIAAPVQAHSIIIFDHVLGSEARYRYLPGWDPDLLEHFDYIKNSCSLSRELLRLLARKGSYSSLHEWLLVCADLKVEVFHVGKAIAQLSYPETGVRELKRGHSTLPALSIVIPTRNSVELLRKCLGFLDTLTLKFELILVDNASDDEAVLSLYDALKRSYEVSIVPFKRSFNYSSMINLGVSKAKYDIFLLLNNDVFITASNTVELAVDYALRPAVGVVGSLLHYPDGRVQHAGMVLSRPSAEDYDTSHVLRFSDGEEGEFFGALTAPHNWQCVTGAFQIVRREVFEAAGGYDEMNFPTEFNDVDFCLHVRVLGLRVVCLPLKGVIHAESSTRSKQNAALAGRLFNDAYQVMCERWAAAYESDPFFNPNLKTSKTPSEKKETTLRTLSLRALETAAGFGQRLFGLLSPSGKPEKNSTSKTRSRMPRKLKDGICLVGPFGTTESAGVLSRRLFAAGDDARIPLSVIDTELQRDALVPNLPLTSLSISDQKVSICMSRPSELPNSLALLGEGRVRVAYPYLFEPSASYQLSAELLAGYDEVWVPSSFAAAIIQERLEVDLRIIPLPLIVEAAPPPSSVNMDMLRIVTCFDCKYQQEHNPLGSIDVFRAAFPATRDVCLQVICRGHLGAEFKSSLLRAIADDDRISMMLESEHESSASGRLSGHVLISMHRTDVPPFDIANALAENMVVVATDWGHSTDLLTPLTGFPIPCARKQVGARDLNRERGIWVEPDFQVAVDELRYVSQNFSSAHLKGFSGRDLVLRNFSQASAAENLRRALSEMSSRYMFEL